MNGMRTIRLLLITVLCFPAAEPDVEALMRNGHWKRARGLAEAA